MTPHAASQWAKAERFLHQTTHLSPADAAAAVLLDRTGQTPKTHSALIGQFCLLVQGDEQGRLLGRAFNLADEIHLIADYDDRKIPTAREATELRATAIDFVAYCRSLL